MVATSKNVPVLSPAWGEFSIPFISSFSILRQMPMLEVNGLRSVRSIRNITYSMLVSIHTLYLERQGLVLFTIFYLGATIQIPFSFHLSTFVEAVISENSLSGRRRGEVRPFISIPVNAISQQ